MLTDLRPYKDETLNDSDKSWVVPNGEVWVVKHVLVLLTTTATVGNRLVAITALDLAAATVAAIVPPYIQAASLAYRWEFAPHLNNSNTYATVALQVGCPEIVLFPGWTLRVRDVNAIDAAADDMSVFFLVEVLSV